MIGAASDGRELLRSVHLHGSLGDRFGPIHRLAVVSPVEAVRALAAQRPGFRRAILEGNWQIVRGDLDRGLELAPDEINFAVGHADLHFVPVVVGAGGKGKGIGKIVTGIALAAGAFFLGPVGFLGGAGGFAGTVARTAFGVGLSMGLRGASALLTHQPVAANNRGGVEERASFIFNGAENVSVQGGCVPLIFGRMRVGSIVISAGLAAEKAT